MSAMAQRARDRAKSKVARITRATSGAIDASGWTEPKDMHADSQTGPKPISRRQFKRGGKVEGSRGIMHAGRKPRASGGVTKTDGSLISTDVKQAAGRADDKHVGGMKKGGRVHKDMGGLALPAAFTPVARKEGGKVHADAAQDKKLIHAMGCKCAKCSGGRVAKMVGGPMMGRPNVRSPMPMNRPMMRAKGGSVTDGTLEGTRPVGGRMARAKGGRARKGMNVNIIIAPPGGAAAARPPMPMPPPGGPVGLHQAPPPMPAPGAAPPMGPPGGGMSPLVRKSGGRAYPIESGAGGGLGRLEKARAYGP
jgi:hypothetical protein